jgi:hypothetical protein
MPDRDADQRADIDGKQDRAGKGNRQKTSTV